MNLRIGCTVEQVFGGWILNLPGDEPSPVIHTRLEAVSYINGRLQNREIDLETAFDATWQIAHSDIPGLLPSGRSN
jgi:hypothetical protein